MEGYLLIDKPKGISSFGVVARIRWLIKSETGHKVKVGHSGTLDPSATGLLILAVGSYTKKLSDLIKKDKTYEVTMLLGQTSTTGDAEGEINQISSKKPTEIDIKKALQALEGDIMQTPPAFSAIKINGQRAYSLARKGQMVKLTPRPVKIYSNELTFYKYPTVNFISKVSSGTYIRSLVEDLGKNLGTSAYMSDLRRTKIANYNIEQAKKIEDLNIETISKHLITLVK